MGYSSGNLDHDIILVDDVIEVIYQFEPIQSLSVSVAKGEGLSESAGVNPVLVGDH